MPKRTDAVGEYVYNRHLKGINSFAQNPARSRLATITRMYTRILSELSMNRFEWTGLPPEIDRRFLELTLFQNALSVFYRDERYNKFFALRGAGAGYINMYDNPTRFTVVGNGRFVGRALKANECVPIWANYLRVPDLDIVMIYATRLAEIDVTLEVNAKSARRNKIITVEENARLSVANINRQLDEGQAAISVAPGFDSSAIQALDLGVDPLSLINIDILSTRTWSKAMTMLGIDNANQDKKERLVAAEVDANNDQIAATRAMALNARQYACEQANTMFAAYGLNMSVEFRSDMEFSNLMPAYENEEGV